MKPDRNYDLEALDDEFDAALDEAEDRHARKLEKIGKRGSCYERTSLAVLKGREARRKRMKSNRAARKRLGKAISVAW